MLHYLSWILRLETRIQTYITLSDKKKTFHCFEVLFGAKHSYLPRHLRETHRRMIENGIQIRGDLELLINFEKKSVENSQKFWSKKIFKV